MKPSTAVREIWENGDDWHWWEQRILHRIVKPYHRKIVGNNGTHLMNRDWDILLVLDGCRHDLYEEVAGRSVDSVISRGSSTPEFMNENFEGQQFPDTVYVTANPQTNIHAGDSFLEMVNVWEDNWDEEWSTVPPEDVSEVARATANQYPNKRIIIHFLQPHYPFIDYPDVLYDGLKIRDEMLGNDPDTSRAHITPWTALARGDADLDHVWEAYRHNMELVYPVARDLAEDLTGKAVITSDHGNAIGEYAWPFPVRVFGHTVGLYTENLVKVPWDVYETTERRDIKADKSISDATTNSDTVEGRLRDLGYM